VTGTLPSWSPLNDPQLSARIQAGLQDQREYLRRDAQRDLYFLERYAWQEYPAKCGRWRRVDAPDALTGDTNVSGPWTKKAWTVDYSWLLLFDPTSRQPIAVHLVGWPTEQRNGQLVAPVGGQTTSVWFAGNPRLCGLFTSVGDGHSAFFGFRLGERGLRRWEGPQHFEQLAAQAAAKPFADAQSAEYGPWLADQPEAPPRPKRFGALRG